MVLFRLMLGDRKIWALGSSTSQSKNWTPLFMERARLVAMVVFPVPPFPLAIEIIIGKLYGLMISY